MKHWRPEVLSLTIYLSREDRCYGTIYARLSLSSLHILLGVKA